MGKNVSKKGGFAHGREEKGRKVRVAGMGKDKKTGPRAVPLRRRMMAVRATKGGLGEIGSGQGKEGDGERRGLAAFAVGEVPDERAKEIDEAFEDADDDEAHEDPFHDFGEE